MSKYTESDFWATLGQVEDVRNELMEIDKKDLENVDFYVSELNKAHYNLQTIQECIKDAWDEMYEVISDFEDFDAVQLLNNREIIRKRVEKAMESIGDFIPDEGETVDEEKDIHYEVFESRDDETETMECFECFEEAASFLQTIRNAFPERSFYADKWTGHGLNAIIEAIEEELSEPLDGENEHE